MALNRIVRHTVPNKYDSAGFGTLCQANYNETSFDIFIQLSHTDEAQWEHVGYLLESAFSELLQNEEFITELINIISTNDNKSYKNLAAILNKK
jgi:hypothetical protein